MHNAELKLIRVQHLAHDAGNRDVLFDVFRYFLCDRNIHSAGTRFEKYLIDKRKSRCSMI